MLARILVVAVVGIVLVLGVACEMRIWQECRSSGHSMLFCVRLLSK